MCNMRVSELESQKNELYVGRTVRRVTSRSQRNRAWHSLCQDAQAREFTVNVNRFEERISGTWASFDETQTKYWATARSRF